MANPEDILKRVKKEMQSAVGRGDWQAVARAAGELARLQPADPVAHYNLGAALLRLRQWQEAGKAFQRAVSLKSDHEPARRGIEYVRKKLAQQAPSPSVGSAGETLLQNGPDESVGDAGATVEQTAGSIGAAIAKEELPANGQAVPPFQEVSPEPLVAPPEKPESPGAREPIPESELTGLGRIWKHDEVIDGLYRITGGPFKGGMGAVYLAHHTQWNVPLAIKSPHERIYKNEAGRARYVQEAETWISLDMHPNIVGAYYVREIEGIPRFFIEAADGYELADWIRAGRIRDLATALDMAIQICRGMAYVHKKGLVHRDLKPSNVMMMKEGAARVSDFGLGKILGKSEEATESDDRLIVVSSGSVSSFAGRFKGTPEYAAPEQFTDSRSVTPAADVYAFGMVLLEMLFGRYPFKRPDLAGLPPKEAYAKRFAWYRKLHCETVFPSFAEMLAERFPEIRNLQSEIRNLQGRLLSKEARERPRDFEEVEALLRGLYESCLGGPYPRPALEDISLLADGLNNRAVSYLDLARRQELDETRNRAYLQQAEEKLREALSNEPSHLEATFNLAILEWQEGRIDDRAVANRLAEACGRSALGASAMALACQVHLARGGLDAMGDVLDLPLQGSEEPETLGAIGTALAAKGAHAAAEKVLSQALRGEAKNPWVFASYIRALQALGKEDMARRALSQGRSRFGDFPESVEEVCNAYHPWHCAKQSEFVCKGDERIVDFDLSRDGELAVLARNDNTILLLDARSGEALNQFRLPRQSAKANLSQFLLSGGVETRTLRHVRFAGEPPAGDVPEIVVFWEQTRLHYRKKQAAESSGNTLYGRVRIASPRGKVQWLSQTPLTPGRIYDLREIGRGRFLFRLSGGRVMGCSLDPADDAVYRYALDRISDSVSVERLSKLEFSPPRGPLVFVESDGRLLWADVADYATKYVYQPAGFEARCAQISTDGRWLVAGDRSGRLALRDAASGQFKWTAKLHQGEIVCVAISPNAHLAACRGNDGLVRMVSLENAFALRTLEALPTVEPRLCFNSDWTRMAFVSGNGHWQCWVVDYGGGRAYELRPVLCRFRGVGEITRLAGIYREKCDEAERALARTDLKKAYALAREAQRIEGYEQQERAVDLLFRLRRKAGRVTFRAGWPTRLLVGRAKSISALAFAPDTATLAAAGSDGRVLLWDLVTGRERRLEAPGGAAMQSVAFHPNGRSLFAGDRAGSLHVWHTATGAHVQARRMTNTWITALDFREEGDLFLVAGGDSVRVCQTDPLGEVVSLTYPRSVVNAACFGPEDLVFAGYADRAVVFWDRRRALRQSVNSRHRDEVTALAVSPDKTRLVSAGRDGDVNVWDVPTGKPVATLAEHRDSVFAAAWCSRSPYVVTGGGHADQRGDTKIRLWDTQAARCVRAFEAHESAIVALAASPNGRFVASADRQGQIRIWEYDWDLEF